MRVSLALLLLIIASTANAIDCEGGAIPEVFIKAGSTEILAGRVDDPTTSRVLRSSEGFCISVNEVSVTQYNECVEDGVCSKLRGKQTRPQMPVHSVTFDEVLVFVDWMSKMHSLPYRLPSEVEWQVAALAGDDHPFPWRIYGQLKDANIFSKAMVEVDKTEANAFGVRDLVGNVAEFVADCHTNDIQLIPDNGSPFKTDECRDWLTKGGHYSAPSFMISPYFRTHVPLDFASPQIGFRIARSPE